MNISLNGKTAFVSGATSGIGKAIAEKLAKSKCNLVLATRTLSSLQKVSLELSEKNNVGVDYLVTDFNSPNDLKSKVSSYLKRKNTGIDILINCVGGPIPVDIEKVTPEGMIQTLNRHVVSSKILTDEFLPNMIEKGFGRIVNVIGTIFKTPYPGLGLSFIRGAEASWVKALSNEVINYGITVNSILPGPTDTPELQNIIKVLANNRGLTYRQLEEQILNTIPIKRFATPDEIAVAALFIASTEASYLTGTSLNIDGGFSPSL